MAVHGAGQHGAGQGADEMFDYLGTAPEGACVALLAPNSRDSTWDAIGGSFGPDVKFLNRARQILDSPSKWNRNSTQNCRADAKTFGLNARLVDFSRDPTTTFADIQKLLQLVEERLAKQLSEKPVNK